MCTMKNILTILILLLAINLNAQDLVPSLEKNPNWVKYTTLIEKTPYAKNYWSNEYTLKNGTIDSYNTFFNQDLRASIKLAYDNNNNVMYSIITSQIDNRITVDTLNVNSKYNLEGLKTEDDYYKYVYDKNQLMHSKYSKDWESSNGKQGLTIQYKHDAAGNIIRQEQTNNRNGQSQIDIEEYTYDKYGNVLTITRSATPNRMYPVIMIGGRSLPQFETFEYEYNTDHLWIKKYTVIKGKKTLIAEREIK